MITCEFTAHGNQCPDADCILDHTLVISSSNTLVKSTVVVATTQLIMWNTRKGFGPAE